jgi:putative ATP-dependent endonuclease of the OLD family
VRIHSVRIQNLRAFKDETVYFNNYTCLVGPNGSGKSTVLCALNVFFREARDVATNLQQLHEEDFHCKNTNEPIQITVTFVDLSLEAESTFKHYFRQGRLIVSTIAKYDAARKCATVEQLVALPHELGYPTTPVDSRKMLLVIRSATMTPSCWRRRYGHQDDSHRTG